MEKKLDLRKVRLPICLGDIDGPHTACIGFDPLEKYPDMCKYDKYVEGAGKSCTKPGWDKLQEV